MNITFRKIISFKVKIRFKMGENMRYREKKPIQRSKLRLILGRQYYTFKKEVPDRSKH